MKSALYLLAVTLIIFSTACNKPVELGAEKLQGKWLLVEYYGGYANGGHFIWEPVPLRYAHILQFGKAGEYSKTEKANGVQCIGNINCYQVLN